MSIKVKILKENQEEGNEEQEKLAGDVKSVQKAVASNQATKTAMSKINTVDEFVQAMLAMIDQIDDNMDQKKIPLLIKKAYDEYRKKGKGTVNESLTSILTDPVILGSLAAALGVSVAALRGALSGGSDSSALDDIRAKIEADSAYADELTRASREKREREKKIRMARYRKNLEKMKADRAGTMGSIDSDNSMGQIPMKLDGDEVEAAADPSDIPDNIVRRFVRAKRMADDPRTDPGTAQNAQKHVDKMRAEYPGIDDHPDSGLYEIFKRFL